MKARYLIDSLFESLTPGDVIALLEPRKGSVALWLTSTHKLNITRVWKNESRNIWDSSEAISEEIDIYMDIKPMAACWDPDKDGIASMSVGLCKGKWIVTVPVRKHRGLFSVDDNVFKEMTYKIIEESSKTALYDPFDL